MNKQLVHIVVEAKSSFGVKDQLTGNWFNPTKKLAGAILPLFNIGGAYDIEMESSKGKDGKTYNNIVAIVGNASSPVFSPPAAVVAPKATAAKAADGKGLLPGGALPINKDERILVQGLTQALLQSPVMSTVESKDLIAFVEKNVVALVEMVRKLAK